MSRDLVFGFFGALGVHAGVIMGWGGAWIQPAQFGIQQDTSSVEVSLVAAAPAPSVSPPPAAPSSEKSHELLLSFPDPDAWPLTQPEPFRMISHESPSKNQDADRKAESSPARPRQQGGNKSDSHGVDAVHLAAHHGANPMAQPDYLRNPPPVYPESARRMGRQGVVMLEVQVKADGESEEVVLRRSSGCPALDESALKAVRKWKFHPARQGTLAVGSRVEIPICFQLR